MTFSIPPSSVFATTDSSKAPSNFASMPLRSLAKGLVFPLFRLSSMALTRLELSSVALSFSASLTIDSKLNLERVGSGDARGSKALLNLGPDGVDGVTLFAGGARLGNSSGKDTSESDSSSSELLTTLPGTPLLEEAGNTAHSGGLSDGSLLVGGDKLDVILSCSELLDAFEFV